jgi:hypothetical protein
MKNRPAARTISLAAFRAHLALQRIYAFAGLSLIGEIESPRAAPDGQRVTMEQAGREFCQRLELKGRRKSHRLTVASDLRNHIAPFFATKTLDRIGP